MTFTVRDLLRATGGELISGYPHHRFSRVSIDSRTLMPGEAFFALAGPKFDGHNYLQAASERGAALVVVQSLDQRLSFHPRRVPDVVRVTDTYKALQGLGRFAKSQSQARMIGITGSNGKTTTKEMLASILRRVGSTLATRGNLNNHIGLPLTLCELEENDRFAVIEMGTSKPGDMKVLAEILHPTVALITNVGKDHLEFLGSPHGVLKENRLLFDILPADGVAIINLDDPLLKPLAKRLSCKTVTYGKDTAADVRLGEVEMQGLNLRFNLSIRTQDISITLRLAGPLQALNAAAAAATAHALGVRPDDIVAGIEAFKPALMRLQVHERSDGAILVNDAYNANPSSVRSSVESFSQSYSDRPRWVVLGDMRELGPTARQEHEDLGRWLATQPLDRIFLYGRDTRFIFAGAAAGGAVGRLERFRKKRYLMDRLANALSAEQPAVLFKASRIMKLEDVIEPLTLVPSPEGRGWAAGQVRG